MEERIERQELLLKILKGRRTDVGEVYCNNVVGTYYVSNSFKTSIRKYLRGSGQMG